MIILDTKYRIHCRRCDCTFTIKPNTYDQAYIYVDGLGVKHVNCPNCGKAISKLHWRKEK